MRLFTPILVILYWTVASFGQVSPTGWITTDVKKGQIHLLETKEITLVVRATYSYNFSLINNERGIQGCLISIDGVIPNREDEMIFVNDKGKRKSFLFTMYPEKSKRGARPIYTNCFYLGKDGIKWLRSNRILKFYIKNNEKLEMKKFSLTTSRYQSLTALVLSFDNQLDRSMIINNPDAIITASNTKWYRTNKKSNLKSQTDETDIDNSNRDYVNEKEKLISNIQKNKNSQRSK